MTKNTKHKVKKGWFFIFFILFVLTGMSILVNLAYQSLNPKNQSSTQTQYFDKNVETAIFNLPDTASDLPNFSENKAIEQLNPEITEQNEGDIDHINQLNSEDGKPIDPTNRAGQSLLDNLF